MKRAENLEKVSAQGVREYPISKHQAQNEDLDDVYEHVPTKQTTDLAENEEVIMNQSKLTKRRRSAVSDSDAKRLLKAK